jgi:hypothetical protein
MTSRKPGGHVGSGTPGGRRELKRTEEHRPPQHIGQISADRQRPSGPSG